MSGLDGMRSLGEASYEFGAPREDPAVAAGAEAEAHAVGEACYSFDTPPAARGARSKPAGSDAPRPLDFSCMQVASASISRSGNQVHLNATFDPMTTGTFTCSARKLKAGGETPAEVGVKLTRRLGDGRSESNTFAVQGKQREDFVTTLEKLHAGACGSADAIQLALKFLK
jgi:hypothetical protein